MLHCSIYFLYYLFVLCKNKDNNNIVMSPWCRSTVTLQTRPRTVDEHLRRQHSSCRTIGNCCIFSRCKSTAIWLATIYIYSHAHTHVHNHRACRHDTFTLTTGERHHSMYLMHATRSIKAMHTEACSFESHLMVRPSVSPSVRLRTTSPDSGVSTLYPSTGCMCPDV